VQARDSSFRLEDLAAALKSRGIAVKKRNQGRLVDILHRSSLVLSRDDRVFFPRQGYFRGARFLVAPTREEIEEGILIPGHRFLPFSSHEILPWHCTLTDPRGRPVETRRVRKKIEDLLIYYTLFGLKNLPMILARDDEANIEALQESDIYGGSALITVYDMAGVYRELGFGPEDALVISVEDWQRGALRFEHLSARKRLGSDSKEEEWTLRLEAGFELAFGALGFPADMEEVIAYAFFYAGQELLAHPRLHLGGFLEKTEKVSLVTVGTDTCLWRKGENPERVITSRGPLEGPRGDDDCLEAILNDLGISLSPEEIEAYMRDELFGRGADLGRVLDRCLLGRQIEFYDRGQEKAFYRFVHELWEEIHAGYQSGTDQTAGKLRHRALQILDDHLMWLRSLDTRGLNPEDLPVRSLFEIGQAVGQVGQLLTALNHIRNIPDDEFATMDEVLQMLEGAIWEKIEAVESALKGSSDPPAREGEREPASGPRERTKPRFIYVLKVALKGTHPPVWRRVQVPGSYTLESLHRVVQAIMGWSNCHLHSFQIAGTEYTDPRTALKGFLCYKDEAEVTLEEILSQENLSFSYEYDFGDSWEHRITVEKILPASEVMVEEQDRAICLKGRRACPPEDCGGAARYREILDALKKPADPLHAAYLSKIEDFDPERIAIDEINRRLKEL
jgi:hypothetical protein